MKKNKISFFKRVKNAIINFEKYSDFAVEKIDISIKYFAKIMIIFSIIISICVSYKFSTIINDEEQVQIMCNQLENNGLDIKIVDETIKYVQGNNGAEFYILLTLCLIVGTFVTYFLLGFADVLLISILGFIISRLARVMLKYKPIFIMSVYALTLPIILNCIYTVVNMLTGYTINYFPIVYNIIADIYIITAIFMIKTDFIEQQMELSKIVAEQEKVRQEFEYDGEEKKDDNEKEPEEKKDEDKTPKKEPNSEPET